MAVLTISPDLVADLLAPFWVSLGFVDFGANMTLPTIALVPFPQERTAAVIPRGTVRLTSSLV